MTADMPVRLALVRAAARFGFSQTPRLDAELLMAHALGVTREVMLLARLNDPAPPGYADLVERRARHEPIAYLTGTRSFWTIDLAVGPGVLVPRADSETLIEAAVSHFGKQGPRTVLDLGTGPGTLLLAALAEWPEARGLGIDADERALTYARRNIVALGVADRAEVRLGNWTAGVEGQFDLILCNPPYIGTGEELPAEVRDHEPGTALFAGADGLDDYRRIAPAVPRLIAPGGLACVEIGSSQGEAAAAMFRAQGLGVAIRQDLGGRDRCLVVTP